MIVLGIESTAHTFGASVIDTDKKGVDKILSNIRRMATTETGGMIPIKVAEHHEEVVREVIDEAIVSSEYSWDDIELIAVSNAPGMGHALRIGVVAARTLALKYDKPVVGVNHCVAHLEVASMITDAKDPVLLYCSGANTQVIAYDAGLYRVFGETLDTGVGNFLDTLARNMGLGFPGGPKIEALADKYVAHGNNALLDIPYTVKGMDVAFSGILTSVSSRIESEDNNALAYSVQETVFAMLVEVAERALAHCNKDELVLGGGVACNKRLQEMCQRMCDARGVTLYTPPNQLLVDNAAMIAWTGHVMYTSGQVDRPELLKMKPYERTDDVVVSWR